MWAEVENMNREKQEHMSKDVKVALWAALLTAVAKMLEGKSQSIRVAFDLSGAYPVPGKERKVSRKAVRAAVNRWLKAGRTPKDDEGGRNNPGRKVFREAFKSDAAVTRASDATVAGFVRSTKGSRTKGQHALIGVFLAVQGIERTAAKQGRIAAAVATGKAWFVTVTCTVAGAKFNVQGLVDKDRKSYDRHLAAIEDGAAFPSRKKALGAAARAVFGPTWSEGGMADAHRAAVAHMVGQGKTADTAKPLDDETLARLRAKGGVVATPDITTTLKAAQVKAVAASMGIREGTKAANLAALAARGLTAEAIEAVASALGV
jgi:hypothetical protein